MYHYHQAGRIEGGEVQRRGQKAQITHRQYHRATEKYTSPGQDFDLSRRVGKDRDSRCRPQPHQRHGRHVVDSRQGIQESTCSGRCRSRSNSDPRAGTECPCADKHGPRITGRSRSLGRKLEGEEASWRTCPELALIIRRVEYWDHLWRSLRGTRQVPLCGGGCKMDKRTCRCMDVDGGWGEGDLECLCIRRERKENDRPRRHSAPRICFISSENLLVILPRKTVTSLVTYRRIFSVKRWSAPVVPPHHHHQRLLIPARPAPARSARLPPRPPRPTPACRDTSSFLSGRLYRCYDAM